MGRMIMKNNNEIKQQSSARRNILKSIALGGGVVATAASLPKEWTKPVLDQVLLPAHAQMSSPTQGTYATTASLGLNFNRDTDGFAETQYALLDMLVSPVNAGHPAAINFCGQDDADAISDATLFIRINANMSVDLAIDSLDLSTPSVCGAVSNLTGNTIDDVDIRLSTGDFYYVRLSGMVAMGTEVTGSYETVTTNSNNENDPRVPATDDEFCTGSFTANLGGSFPVSFSETCIGIDD